MIIDLKQLEETILDDLIQHSQFTNINIPKELGIHRPNSNMRIMVRCIVRNIVSEVCDATSRAIDEAVTS